MTPLKKSVQSEPEISLKTWPNSFRKMSDSLLINTDLLIESVLRGVRMENVDGVLSDAAPERVFEETENGHACQFMTKPYRNFHRLPDETKYTAKGAGKSILRFPHCSFIIIRGAPGNPKNGGKTKYRSGERRFRYREMKFSAGTMAFLRGMPESVPGFRTALISKNTV